MNNFLPLNLRIQKKNVLESSQTSMVVSGGNKKLNIWITSKETETIIKCLPEPNANDSTSKF